MSEKSIQHAMGDVWKLNGAEITNIDGCATAGVPDQLIIFPGGVTIWLEWKRERPPMRNLPLSGKEIRPPQRLWLHSNAEKGALCYIVLATLAGTFAVIPGINSYDCASYTRLELLQGAVSRKAFIDFILRLGRGN